MSNVIMINCLLTRRCNLSCEYCDLVKNYKNKPKEYPDPKTIVERSADDWIKDFEILKNYYKEKDLFVILYGGEPFLYEDLDNIIKYLNSSNTPYTIITNAMIPGLDEKIVQMEIRGLSCSVDPKSMIDQNHRFRKSNKGYQLLKKIKSLIPECDCTAEIVVDDNNINNLEELVELLTKEKIWSSITIAENKKNKYYDFASDISTSIATSDIIAPIFTKLHDRAKTGELLIHIPEILHWLVKIAPMENVSCGGLTRTITIEPDGSIRTCLRIRGLYTPIYKVEHLIDKFLVVEESWKNDFMQLCKGCAWTCPAMPLISKKYNDITHKK